MADLSAWDGFKVLRVGSGGGTAASNIQLDLLLSPDNFGAEFALCKEDLADLRISLDEGDPDDQTLVPFYLRSGEASQELALLTVKVPSISATLPTFLRVWYGNAAASSASSYWDTHESAPSVAGAISAFAFAEGSGTTAANALSGPDFTLYNTPTWGDHSLTFTAASSEFAIADYLMDAPGTEGTIFFSITVNSNTADRVFGQFNKNGPVYDGLDSSLNVFEGGFRKLRILKYNNSALATLTSISKIETGVRYDCAVQYGPGGFKLWINGNVEDHLPAETGAWAAGQALPFTIGGYAGGSGNFSDVTFHAPGFVFIPGRTLSDRELIDLQRRWKHVAGLRSSILDKMTPVNDGDPIVEGPINPDDSHHIQEPWVLPPASPGGDYVMFFSAPPFGDSGDGMATWRLTSEDGVTWPAADTATKVIGDGAGGAAGTANRPRGLRIGSRIHAYTSTDPSGTAADVVYHYSDDDGVTFTTVGVVIDHADGPGTNEGFGNFVPVAKADASGYEMFAEYSGGGVWIMGLWEKSGAIDSGDPWTYVSGSTERLASLRIGPAGGGYSRLDFFKVGSVYYGVTHNSVAVALPTANYLFVSTNRLDWHPLYESVPADPMKQLAHIPGQDQTADPAWLIEDDRVIRYFDADYNGTNGPGDPYLAAIFAAEFDGTTEELVTDTPTVAIQDDSAVTVVSARISGRKLRVTYSAAVSDDNDFEGITLDFDGKTITPTYESGNGTRVIVFAVPELALTLDYAPGSAVDTEGAFLPAVSAEDVAVSAGGSPESLQRLLRPFV